MKRRAPTHSLVERLGVLGESVRLRVLRLLQAEELSVGEIGAVLQLPQSTVSRHLRTLLDGGWLLKRAEGPATMYRLVLDDLAPEHRALWTAVSAQLLPEDLADDARRLRQVLSDRRTDSEAFFGRVAGEWDALRGELFGNEFLAAALLHLIPSFWRVADLGCGTGNVAEMLAPCVKEVVAVDQSRPMLAAARKRLADAKNVRFVHASLETLPLAASSFDAAILSLVLHHVEDIDAALGAAADILRPGGVLAILDMCEHGRDEYRHRMGHRHLGFSRASISGSLRAAGLEPPTFRELPTTAGARGPGLFIAVAMRPASRRNHTTSPQRS